MSRNILIILTLTIGFLCIKAAPINSTNDEKMNSATTQPERNNEKVYVSNNASSAEVNEKSTIQPQDVVVSTTEKADGPSNASSAEVNEKPTIQPKDVVVSTTEKADDLNNASSAEVNEKSTIQPQDVVVSTTEKAYAPNNASSAEVNEKSTIQPQDVVTAASPAIDIEVPAFPYWVLPISIFAVIMVGIIIYFAFRILYT